MRRDHSSFLLCGAGGLLAATIIRKIPAPPGWYWPERTRDVLNHWTDAFNFLDLIPGPAFLGLFLLYWLVVLVLCWLLRNGLMLLLESGSPVDFVGRLPFTLKPSFMDVAYLRDGRRGMLGAAACNLARLSIITRQFEQFPAGYRPKSVKAEAERVSDLEHAIVDAIEGQQGMSPTALPDDPMVVAQLDRAEAKTRDKLDALGLRPTSVTRAICIFAAIVALLLVDGLGVIRLIRSEMRGYHNLNLLVMLLMLATGITPLALTKIKYSSAGARFLRRLRSDAAGVLRRMQAMTKPGDSGEVMYALAACGIGAVKGTLYHDIYTQMFPEPQRERWSPDLSGSSDSSGSSCSSCSGGSCGGGGCGGGGCGGGGCGGG